jgi:hypothetical protein
MRQRSRRYSSGLSGIAVGAEQEVGTGGGVASLVDVGGVRRGVMACGEEACSREEEPGWAMAVVGSDVPGGCVGLPIGLSPFVSRLRMDPIGKKGLSFEVLITASGEGTVKSGQMSKK